MQVESSKLKELLQLEIKDLHQQLADRDLTTEILNAEIRSLNEVQNTGLVLVHYEYMRV